MLKTMTYQEKFVILKNWIPEIIDQIKKDLRQDHLRRDIGFLKQYFQSKNPSKLSLDELVKGYAAGLSNSEIAEELGEFIANRWLLKNTDLYYFFEENLKKLTTDFEQLNELDPAFATKLSQDGCAHYGPIKTYLFVIMNSVVFPPKILEDLQGLAEKERDNKSLREEENTEARTWQEKERHYQTQISRLEDKYEKKLLGMQKKYQIDIESLKKQIAMLQKKTMDSRTECETFSVPVKSAKR